MLKKCFLTLIACGVIAIGASFAAAQDNQPTTPPSDQQGAPAGHRGMMVDPAQHAQMLAKHLNLTSDQQAKAQSIFENEHSQMESVHNDSSLSQQDRHAKMMEIHKTTTADIRAILNPDQQKKWDAMEARHEGMGRKRGGAEGGDQTPPPQQ